MHILKQARILIAHPQYLSPLVIGWRLYCRSPVGLTLSYMCEVCATVHLILLGHKHEQRQKHEVRLLWVVRPVIILQLSEAVSC